MVIFVSIFVTMEMQLLCSYTQVHNCIYRSNHQNTSEPAYELVTQSTSGDVKLEKNPAYSVTDTQDTSVEHHYDFISDNDHAKVKKQI